MCGRFALKAPPAVLIARFGLDECPDLQLRYNIPPGTDIAAIRQSPEGGQVLHLLRWGLVPHWAKDPSIGHKLSNARAESVVEKPSFRDAFKRRRCLIPADGFYEWQAQSKFKQPYYTSLKSGEPKAMAGLWESWRSPEGEILRTCCVITTDANALMGPIHDRMPVIIEENHWQDWLTAPPEEVETLLAPLTAEGMQAWPVERRVSKVSDEDARLIEPMGTS